MFVSTRRHSRTCGFTLIEVVVALTLLSLIMLVLLGALKTFGDTLSRTDNKIADKETAWLVSRFLRQTISTAFLIADGSGGAIVNTSYFFEGRENELRWIGVMPPRHGAGGLYHLRLRVSREQNVPSLLLEYVVFSGSVHAPDWPLAHRHQLIDGVNSLKLAYQAEDDAAWTQSWSEENRLPARIRVSIDVGESGLALPDLVVNLRKAGVLNGQLTSRRD